MYNLFIFRLADYIKQKHASLQDQELNLPFFLSVSEFAAPIATALPLYLFMGNVSCVSLLGSTAFFT